MSQDRESGRALFGWITILFCAVLALSFYACPPRFAHAQNRIFLPIILRNVVTTTTISTTTTTAGGGTTTSTIFMLPQPPSVGAAVPSIISRGGAPEVVVITLHGARFSSPMGVFLDVAGYYTANVVNESTATISVPKGALFSCVDCSFPMSILGYVVTASGISDFFEIILIP